MSTMEVALKLRDMRLRGFAATHPVLGCLNGDSAEQPVLRTRGGQREIQVPSTGSGNPSAETDKEPQQPRTGSRHVSRSGYFWHRPWSWGSQTSGTGRHRWDLLGALPTSCHYEVVPAGISHPQMTCYHLQQVQQPQTSVA